MGVYATVEASVALQEEAAPCGPFGKGEAARSVGRHGHAGLCERILFFTSWFQPYMLVCVANFYEREATSSATTNIARLTLLYMSAETPDQTAQHIDL